MVLIVITLPPLVITRLLEEPEAPTKSCEELLHRELVPVTKTLLLEEVVALPMLPVASITLPPLEITMLLKEAKLPMMRFDAVRLPGFTELLL